MQKSNPILSICIPTYNRADVLELCLSSIVQNKAFNEEIEVVISDNNSTDDTSSVAQKYAERYQNVLYNRNSQNIGAEKNFIKVLELARGKFKKLHNDYSLFTEFGLKQLVDVVRLHKEDKPLIVFGNWGEIESVSCDHFTELNELVKYARFTLGWLGLYGFWDEDFRQLSNKEAKIDTLFLQTDWFLRMFIQKKDCYFYSSKYVERAEFKQPQGGYNFFDTHINKFLSVFKDYVDSGDLSLSTWEELNRQVYYYMLVWVDRLYITSDAQKFSYGKRSPFKIMYKAFGKYPWFYKRLFRYIPHAIKLYFNVLMHKNDKNEHT